MSFRVLALGGLTLLAPSAARAEADWFASLYTAEGVELRADERVFALYAVLNATGYDEGPVAVEQKLLRAREDQTGLTVILNLLAAPDEALGARREGRTQVVVGPSETPNVEGVLREYARVALEPGVAKAPVWSAGASLL